MLGQRAGLYQFDPDGAEAKALEERLGIPVIRHGKPSLVESCSPLWSKALFLFTTSYVVFSWTSSNE